MSKTWDKCLKTLKQQLSLQDFTLWVKPIVAIEENNSITLVVNNKSSFDWVNKNIGKVITKEIKKNNPNYSVNLKVKPNKKENKPINTPLSKEFSFDNLVVGEANEMVSIAAKQIANNLNTAEYNPFIIYGDSGLGKTHILQATGALAKKNNPNIKVIYTSLMDFVKTITSSLRHNNIEEIKKHYQSAELLLIDDIHHISGKTKSQEEFFHIFNFLFSTKKQIILTSDELPNKITGVEPRLISRFNSGLSLKISPPELELRAAILIKKAEEKKLIISDYIALYIAQKITKNVRELEGAIKTLQAHNNFKKPKIIDESFINEALGDIFEDKTKNIDINHIQKQVAKYFRITLGELLSQNRSKTLVSARQLAMLLSRELTTMSLPDIGKNFSNKDHTTVLYACKKTKEKINSNKEFEQIYKELKLKICE
ncbi:Chromosomal replication initiator protein DnaA [hydrothermal vent metagenome]|uniref:Chromosomal replication initiator protein DnaA n=1 Tax=hydrothermal vent metagenome TaxID=652676 RepID=A0A1W1CRE6_9ZZZZ